ncbi:MAG: TonB-dependent receptor [Desulfobacterales bacterium]|nr:TonB-dependent receptor [Desulfobacterales bacterium]
MIHVILIFISFLFISTHITIADIGTDSKTKRFEILEKIAEDNIQEMELVNLYITTSGRKSQKMIEASSTMSVVTAEDIRLSGATQLTEALIMLPGVDMGYLCPNWQMVGGIRGFSKLPMNKIILMIDGMPWIADVYGIPSLLVLPISLEEIERIEVLRGPGSSLYGANAMFGVINVITKKNEDQQGGHVNLTGGQWETLIGNIRYADSIDDRISYRISTGYETANNTDYIAWQSDPMKELARINANMCYHINQEDTFSLSGAFIDLFHLDYINESTGPVTFEQGTYWGTIAYDSKKPNISMKSYMLKRGKNSGWALGEHIFRFQAESLGIDLQHLVEPVEDDSLVWGANFTQQNVWGQLISGRKLHKSYGLFVDNTYDLLNTFDLENHAMAINGGIRYDHHSITGGSLSHRLALIYSLLNKHYFRFTSGTSYRNPDFVETYYDRTSLYKEADSSIGTPDIYLHIYGQKNNKTEKAMAYELSYNTQFTPRCFFNTNLFYTKVTDFIYFVSQKNAAYFDPSFSGIVVPTPFMNIGNANQYGAEIEMRYVFSDTLSGWINYTYYDQTTHDKQVEQLVSMTPGYMANAILRAVLENGFSSQIGLHYKDSTVWRQYTWNHPERDTNVGGIAPSYWICNARLGYTFHINTTDMEAALSLFNLLNKKYSDFPIDTSDMSRRITVHLSMAF